MADKKDGVNKKSRKNQNKVRVKLPGIESYEKTLEFTAEGPGRVVVRLERLMGSDRIRITDPKYLATLVERLEAEEAQSWGSRSRLRKKAEKNRSRQLAIEGLMEPTEDMQDLYEHPVFRVNRVLNRLAVFDTSMGAGAVNKVPPIVPVEPFAEDETGKIFKSYTQHQIFHREILPYDSRERSGSPSTSAQGRHSRADLTRKSRTSLAARPSIKSLSPSTRDIKHIKPASPEQPSRTISTASAKTTSQAPSSIIGSRSIVKSTNSIVKKDENERASASVKPSEINQPSKSIIKTGKNEGEEYEEEEGAEEEKAPGAGESLRDFRIRYGVPSEANLVRDWQIFRSHLVERVYEETGGSAEELYTLAGDVIGTYDRELETVDDYIVSRADKVKEQREALGLPSVESRQGQDDENGEDEDEQEEEEEGEENEEEEDKDEKGLEEAEEDEVDNTGAEMDEGEEDTELANEDDDENAEDEQEE